MQANTKLSSAETLVSLTSIWKFFGGVAVLKGVNLDLRAGEVHALLGGNGSGKSTLMKILSGAYQKDSGSLAVNSRPLLLADPQSAHEHGIYLVPQEPKVFPNMSVLDNIVCGMKVRQPDIAERATAYAADLGFEGSLLEPASTLSIANQQLLEIIRGLVRDARVLILDEPTSTLTFKEVSSLFKNMRVLAGRGIGIYFISHRLNEVFEIADRVSVLRDGVIVLSKPKSELSSQDVIRAMLPAADSVAADRAAAAAPADSAMKADAAEVFRVESLSGYGFSDVTFSVREGEVLGFAGVVGAGRTELAEAILGLDPFATGKVFMKGVELAKRSPRICLAHGIGYLPEDRHLHGIFLDLPNIQTMSASVLVRLGRPFISRKKEQSLADKFIEDLKIKVFSGAQRSRTLSGGNQQKVVIAKILAGNPDLVILDEPTRGVDAKARQDVYKLIRDIKVQGISVVLISSDLPEIIQESDRILVMHNGRIDAEFNRTEFDLERITSSAFGLSGDKGPQGLGRIA
jgi:AI-2 transport system ATP-binding protein